MEAKVPTNHVRQSNFELLRIIAIILIIAHHIAVHSGFEYPTEVVSVNRIWVQFLQLGGKIGVDLFVLISGYFLISSDKVKIHRALRLWLQLFTYSILLYVVLVVFVKTEPYSTKKLIESLFPLLFSDWWFGKTYFVLYLLHSYVNRLLLSFSRAQYKRYLALLLCIWCVIPTFTQHSSDYNNLIWFIVLYSVAGYYKLHGRNITCKARTLIALSAAVIMLTFLSAVLFDVIGTKITFVGKSATWFYEMNMLPVLLAAVLLFIGFDRIEMKPRRTVNTIASAAFGVYLIHDNSYSRPFLWEKVFNTASYSDSKVLIPYTLLLIVVVFVSCTIIELIRKYGFEKHYLKPLEKLSGKLSSLGNKIAKQKIFDKL